MLGFRDPFLAPLYNIEMTPPETENLSAARQRMIRDDLAGRGIIDRRVLAAFEAVPRERFVPATLRTEAYGDYPLPIGRGQTISQPYIVALMLQLLDVAPEDHVLDIGAGSGYQTALLSRLAERVTAVERLAELAASAQRTLDVLGITNVQIHVADGSTGYGPDAPYDRIVCGAACPRRPPEWDDQLVEGGKIVYPAGGRHVQTLLRAEKRPHGEIRVTEHGGVRFVPLLGKGAWPG